VGEKVKKERFWLVAADDLVVLARGDIRGSDQV
jgi:hypothetical protein